MSDDEANALLQQLSEASVVSLIHKRDSVATGFTYI